MKEIRWVVCVLNSGPVVRGIEAADRSRIASTHHTRNEAREALCRFKQESVDYHREQLKKLGARP